MIPTLTPFFSPLQIQMGIPLQILVYTRWYLSFCWSKLFKSRLCRHSSIYNLVVCRPSCVCYCCCCKCYGLALVSVQSSYTFQSKCRCSSPFENLVSCSLLTSRLYSFNCFSCGNVICGTSYLCSLNCVSCGIVMWYLCSMFCCLYHYWHCRWFHSTPHHFLCPQICVFMFTFHSWT